MLNVVGFLMMMMMMMMMMVVVVVVVVITTTVHCTYSCSLTEHCIQLGYHVLYMSFISFVHTAGIDNANSRCFPDEVIDRIHRFDSYIWRHGTVVGTKGQGTVQYSEVINVSCGNDTAVNEMTR